MCSSDLRMVETVSGSTNTQFAYSPLGSQLAVVQNGTLVSGMVPLPGGDTAVYNSAGLNYIRRTDMLGSSRLATTWAHAVYSKDAYAPYGEPYDETATTDRSFTGQDSDLTQNAGMYDFQFRKLDSTAGRWLSPDPSGWSTVDLTNPQSLNRYAYVNNNPLMSVDPLGLQMIVIRWTNCVVGDKDSPNPVSCTTGWFLYYTPDPGPDVHIYAAYGQSAIVGGGPTIAPVTIKHAPNKPQPPPKKPCPP